MKLVSGLKVHYLNGDEFCIEIEEPKIEVEIMVENITNHMKEKTPFGIIGESVGILINFGEVRTVELDIVDMH